MSSGPSSENQPHPAAVRGFQQSRRNRLLLIGGATLVLVLLASFQVLHRNMVAVFDWAAAIIGDHHIAAPLVFMGLAALSAMLAFFTSGPLVPAALLAWGQWKTMLLLWLGWVIGGLVAYGVARDLGRPLIRSTALGSAIARYENRLSHRTPFIVVLAFQLAMPSEIPGYVLGLARYPFWKYLAALAVGELPYVFVTGYLGTSLLERRVVPLVGYVIISVALGGWAFRSFHRRLDDGKLDGLFHNS